MQHQSSVGGESNIKTYMIKNSSADAIGEFFYQNTFKIIIITSHLKNILSKI